MVDSRLHPEAVAPSTAVIEAVSEANGVEADCLDLLLHDAIDPDALDALFAGRGGANGMVEFEYHGHDIVVDETGQVSLDPDG